MTEHPAQDPLAPQSHARPGRQPASQASLWMQRLAIAATVAWFAGVPILVPVVLGLAWPDDLANRRAATALVTAGLLLGGLLVSAALGQIVPRWGGLYRVGRALLAAAGGMVISMTIGAIFPDTRSAGVHLSLGAAYVLVFGILTLGRSSPDGRLSVVAALTRMGLTRPGAMGWALAAVAVIGWPWFVVGALGDVRQSLAIAFGAMASGLVAELLWRGLVLALLSTILPRRWLVALIGLVLFSMGTLGQAAVAGQLDQLWPALIAIPAAAVSSELWARPGPGREGVWGAVVFQALFLALPRLFVDPRSVFEPTHLISHAYAPIAAGSLALALYAGRKLWDRLRSPLRPSPWRHLLTAAVPWAVSLGLYGLAGEPGFSNDGYLIILRQQADLSPFASLSDREARIGRIRAALLETAQATQGEIRADLDRMGLSYRPYYLVNMVRVDGTTRGMAHFASRSDVDQVILNPNVRQYGVRWPVPYQSPTDSVSDPPWNLDAIDAERVWEIGITGAGIVVAGSDSGVDWQHPALVDSYRGWDGNTVNHDYNWHDAWDQSPAAFDDDLHGTHTLGTVVGNEVGVAPDARWIGCRNMRRGLGNPGSYVECMEFFLAPYPTDGDPFRDGDTNMAPHVINNSWGCPPSEGCVGREPIHTAVEALRAAGIMMVVSAGNDGPQCETVWLPASEDAVFSVGASDSADRVVGFSSRGPAPDGGIKPDVLAPGVAVLSSIPGGRYALSDGTSMSGPHVAGIVALMWSANPRLAGDISRTEQVLTQTADWEAGFDSCAAGLQGGRLGWSSEPCRCGQDEPGVLPSNIHGYGIANALEAVLAAQQQ